MYPRKCVCCQNGIIEGPYDICSFCGWEDDEVQNNDEYYSGGANKESLIECRMKYLSKTGEWINNIRIPILEDTDIVKAFYTTIDNCAWKYGKEGAAENVLRLAKTMGTDTDHMIMLNQTHTDAVRVVTLSDGGEMVNRPLTKEGFDGMVTNEKGLMLCTVEADCVPVYILDPVKKAIGMVHSGWRGTAGVISSNAVNLMVKEYGSNPKDIMVVIGPCICKNCYEVGAELKEEFAKNYSESEIERFFIPKENGKYYLDLIKAIRIALVKCGIQNEKIEDTGVCTFESKNLCSWRRDNPVMRSMLTAIVLK